MQYAMTKNSDKQANATTEALQHVMVQYSFSNSKPQNTLNTSFPAKY